MFHKTFCVVLYMLMGSLISNCGPLNQNILNVEKSLLNGQWEVIETNITQFDHISFCENLTVGSIFHFDDSGEVLVYHKNMRRPCNNKQYYQKDTKSIIFQEWDMIFDYEIKYLTLKELSFVIDRTPSHLYDDMETEDYTESEEFLEVKENGVILKLRKKDDD